MKADEAIEVLEKHIGSLTEDIKMLHDVKNNQADEVWPHLTHLSP